MYTDKCCYFNVVGLHKWITAHKRSASFDGAPRLGHLIAWMNAVVCNMLGSLPGIKCGIKVERSGLIV